MGRLILRDPAFDDINDIADYIAKDNIGAARRGYEAVERALDYLRDLPGMGPLRQFESSKLKDLRSWPVTGY